MSRRSEIQRMSRRSEIQKCIVLTGNQNKFGMVGVEIQNKSSHFFFDET